MESLLVLWEIIVAPLGVVGREWSSLMSELLSEVVFLMFVVSDEWLMKLSGSFILNVFGRWYQTLWLGGVDLKGIHLGQLEAHDNG